MAGLGSWLALVRFHEYGPLFLLCAVAGALLAGGTASFAALGLLVFVTTFSVSAFVLNDVTDAEDDSRRSSVRNPVAKGEVSRSQATAFFALTSALSVAIALLLGAQDIALAVALFGLCWGYSLGPRFKAHPVSDLAVHGMVPAAFVLMGYALYLPLSAGALLLSMTVASFSAMSGVLQELRDVAQDVVSRRTTVVAIGPKKSASLALVLAAVGVLLFAALPLLGYVDLTLVFFAPLGVVLVLPLLGLRSGSTDAEGAIVKVRNRGVVLALLVISADALLLILGR